MTPKEELKEALTKIALEVSTLGEVATDDHDKPLVRDGEVIRATPSAAYFSAIMKWYDKLDSGGGSGGATGNPIADAINAARKALEVGPVDKEGEDFTSR